MPAFRAAPSVDARVSNSGGWGTAPGDGGIVRGAVPLKELVPPFPDVRCGEEGGRVPEDGQPPASAALGTSSRGHAGDGSTSSSFAVAVGTTAMA